MRIIVKILMIAPVIDAGMGVWLQEICPILEKSHELTLLKSDRHEMNISCKKNVVLHTWKFPYELYRYMPGLKKLLHDGFFNNFDIIHLNSFSVYATDFILKNRKKISASIIIQSHGNLQNKKRSIMKKIHDYYTLKSINKIDHVISVSSAEKNQLIKLGFSSDMITVSYGGVKIETKPRQEKEKEILYFGRLAPTKNVEILIEALALSKIKDSQLIIAGKDYGSLKYLQELTRKLGLTNRISFLNEISEKKKLELLSTSTVFVHPSTSDIYALTLLEAAAAGVPCIAFDIEGIREIFSEEKTGILVNTLTAQDLSDTIDRVLTDKNLRAEISKRCMEIIPKKFSWEKTAKTTELVYSKFN